MLRARRTARHVGFSALSGAPVAVVRKIASMRFTDSQRRTLWLAVGVSLLAHALLLSLAFSGPGLGTPGLGLNWRDRRVDAPEVRVVMVPARVAAAQPTAAPSEPLAPATAATATATATAPSDTTPTTVAMPEAQAVATVPDSAEATPVAPAADPTARLGTLAPGTSAPARTIAADKIALDAPRQTAWTVPGELALPMPLPTPMAAIAPAPIASSPERALPAARAVNAEVLARITPLARERAVDLSQLDSAAQEARRQIEQLQASSAEAERLEAAREQAARQLAARQEAARQDAVRQEAARSEAARVAEREEAARQDAARQAAAQAETAGQEAARQEAARQAAARQEAARALATQADADNARREASRRAMGRQLDEEAARRREAESAASAISLPSAASAAVRQAAPLPLSWSSARRGRLLGRADPNAELVLYAEAWARKIQLNMTIDQVRDAAQQRHTSPLVTVALRQDGSVESVTFVVSSGVPQIDDAIRRIVQGQAPYPAFPPALARDFDVIEIRRTWTFDTAVRLY